MRARHIYIVDHHQPVWLCAQLTPTVCRPIPYMQARTSTCRLATGARERLARNALGLGYPAMHGRQQTGKRDQGLDTRQTRYQRSEQTSTLPT